MILKMQKLTLIGFLDEKEAVLKELMKKKCVQIMGPEDVKDYDSIAELSTLGTAQTYDLEQELAKFTSAIRAVSEYVEKPGLFDKKEAVPFSTLLDTELYQRSAALRDQIADVVKRIGDWNSVKVRNSFQITSLEPWCSLDADLSETETKACSVLYLTVPAELDPSQLDRLLQEATPLCYLKEVHASAENRYLALLYHNEAREAVFDVLKGFNTNRPDFSALHGTAVGNISALRKENEEADREIEALTGQLKEFAKQSPLLKTGSDIITMKIDEQEARQKVFNTQSVFALNGWIVKDNSDKVKKILDKFQCYYQLADPAEGEEPPIKLKNSKFAQPYELITEMYSLPTFDGIDPDPFMAPFFILFFGMMLADAGYGLIITGLCLFVLFKMKPDEGFLKNVMHIGVGCGISTIVWGLLYGGFFGNLITQIAESWFGVTFKMPALLDPLGDPMTIMILSFLLGAVHLFVGMGAKAYMMIQRGDKWGAIFDIGLWYVLLVGLPMLILPATRTIGMVLSIGGAIGLILTQGRAEKNIFMKLIKGVMSLYDITSYLSDILSYSRCLALGLAGGVIANVVNIMGTLPGLNIIGIIAFVLIFLGGHVFNLAISGLGAYVHTSRLQYVEFFGKFYEAGGKPFKPFKANTKYTLISDKEEL